MITLEEYKQQRRQGKTAEEMRQQYGGANSRSAASASSGSGGIPSFEEYKAARRSGVSSEDMMSAAQSYAKAQREYARQMYRYQDQHQNAYKDAGFTSIEDYQKAVEDYMAGQSAWQEKRQSGVSGEDWYQEATKRSAELGKQVSASTKGTLIDRLTEAVSGNNLAVGAALAREENAKAAENDALYQEYLKALKEQQYAAQYRYSDIPESEDFEAISREGLEEAAAYKKEADLRYYTGLSVADNAPGLAGLFNIYATDESYHLPTEEWTDDERAIYGYLFKIDRERAEEYAQGINDRRNFQKRQEQMQEITENVDAGDWAMARFAGLISGVDYLDKVVEYSARGTTTQRADVTLTEFSNGVDSAIAQKINEKHGTVNEDVFVLGGKGWGDAYQLGMSMIDSMVSVLVGGEYGSLAIFFGKAASSGYDEAMRRGATPGQAIASGFAQGAAEVIFEKFSVDQIITMAETGMLKDIVGNILKSGVIEGSEELATSIANMLTDELIMGSNSEFNQTVRDLMAQGMSSDEAIRKATTESIGSLMYDALGGAISGAAHAVAATSAGAARNQYSAARTTFEGDTGALLDMADAAGADSDAAKYAQKLRAQLDKKGDISLLQAERLDRKAIKGLDSQDLQTRSQAVEQRLRQLEQARAGETTAAGGDSSASLRSAQNDSKKGSSAQRRREATSPLGNDSKKGSSARNDAKAGSTSKLATAIAKSSMGQKLNRSEQKLIAESRYGQRVANEIAAKNMEAGDYDSDWARSIGQYRNRTDLYGEREIKRTEAALNKKASASVQTEGGKRERVSGEIIGMDAGKGTATLKTKEGKTYSVPISEVSSASMRQLLTGASVLGGDAGTVVRAYQSGQDIDAYVAAMDAAINLYAAQGVKREILDRSEITKQLTDAQREAAWARGRAKFEAAKERATSRVAPTSETAKAKGNVLKSNKEGKVKGKGRVSYDGATIDGKKYPGVKRSELSERQRAQVDAAAELCKALGIDLAVYAGDRDGGTQGAYQSGGTVYLNVNAGQAIGETLIISTLSHELTHFAEEYGGETYQELREFVIRTLADGDTARFEALVENKRKALGLDYEEALSEVVADGCETMLKNSEAITRLAEENQSLFQKIGKWLSELLEKIFNAFEGVSARHEEAKMLMGHAEELQKRWDAALVEAAKRHAAEQESGGTKKAATEGGGVQYSIARTSKMTLKEQLKEFYNGKMPSGDSFFLGNTPDTLNGAGIESLPLVLTQNSFRKSKSEKHNTPRRVFNEIQEKLSTPLFSFGKGDQIGVVIDDIDADGHQILVGIHKGVEMDRKRVNAVRSIYGLEHPAEWLNNQIEAGKAMTVWNEKKTNDFLQTYGYKASMGEIVRLSEENVSQAGDNVKTQNSEWDGAVAEAAKRHAAEQESGGTKKAATEGGKVQYSKTGTRADGIEVYETSEATKNLSYKQRISQYLDIMKNQYRGRTAKFTRNGHNYYAIFTEKDVRKDMYGDKRSSEKGQKAKINVGADGNIFELVENSSYNGSGIERGKANRAHKGIKYWDYFVKTVQIDGMVYDLIANIRKSQNDTYVYSIQLNENKNVKAAPPRSNTAKQPAFNGAPTASISSKAQNASNVKPQKSEWDGAVSDRELLLEAAVAEAAKRHAAEQESENTKKAATEGGRVQYSIETLPDGKKYVRADRQVLTGDDPKRWGKQMADFINEEIRHGQDVAIPTSDGHILLLTGRSSYKLSDRHTATIAAKVEQFMSDEDYARKGRAAVHIDELIQVARFDGYSPDIDGRHENDIGEDGFNYFEAYFMDHDGKYFRISFSAGINENEETVYNIGSIRERRHPASGRSSSQRKAHTNRGSSSHGEALKSGRKPSADIIRTSEDKSQEIKTAIQIAYEKALAAKQGKTQNSTDDVVSDRELLLEAAEREDASDAVKKYARKVRDLQSYQRRLERQQKKLGEMEDSESYARKQSAEAERLRERMERREKVIKKLMEERSEIAEKVTDETRKHAARGEKWAKKMVGELEAKDRAIDRKRTKQKEDTSKLGELGEAGDSSTTLRSAQGEIAALKGRIAETERLIAKAEDTLRKMEARSEVKSEVDKARERWWNTDMGDAVRTSREIQRENRELKAQVDYYREQAKRTTPENRRVDSRDVKRFAEALRREHGSEADMETLQAYLQEIGDTLVSSDGSELNDKELRKLAKEAARLIVDESYTVNNENEELYQKIKRALRETRLFASDELKGDIPDYNLWRKAHLGTLTLTKDGMPIDTFYQELTETYGEGLFPSTVTAHRDQIYQILGTLDALEPSYSQTYSKYEKNAVVPLVAQEIMDTMLSGEIREQETMADLNYRRMQEMLTEARERAETAEGKLAAERQARRELTQEKVKQMRQQMEESREAQQLKRNIERMQKRLSRMLRENSAKRHIPEGMKAAVGSFLQRLDMLGPFASEERAQAYWDEMDEIRQIVQRGGVKTGERVESYDLDLPEDLAEDMQEHMNAVKEAAKGDERYTIRKMKLEQLRELETIMSTISTAVSNANIILTDGGRYRTVDEAAAESMVHMDEIRARKGEREWQRVVRSFLAWDNTNPIYAFKRFGAGGEAIFKSIYKGWGRMAMNAQQVIQFAENAYTAEYARECEKTEYSFQLRRRLGREGEEIFSEPETVTMNKAQVMSLYALKRRKQAQGHLLSAGIRVGNYKSGSRPVKQVDHYMLSLQDIAEITSVLSEEDIKVVDALQNYMNTIGSEWGNRVSMKRWGVRMFTEENYFPITVDGNVLDAKTPEGAKGGIYRLLNMSFTKSLTKNANNAIMLENVFDVFANHMADMAKYEALALPILDAMHWFNYSEGTNSDGNLTTLKTSMERAFGQEASKYFLNFMQDLNGSQEGGRGESGLKRLISNYKVAAVSANLRVAIQQPTSIARAALLLDPKYIVKGAAMKGGIQEALRCSGLAVWKDLGYFDTNINRGLREQIKHADSLRDKVNEKAMMLAEWGDKATWGALWNACKLEVMDKQGLSGDALLEATADRFDEVIMKTQVMDSTITRSQNMRSSSALVNQLSAFKAEPTLTYNTMMDVFSDFVIEKRKGMDIAWKKHGQRLARAVTVWATSQALTAIAAALVDAMRDDDDYETFLEKWLKEHFWENFKDNMNPLNYLPFIDQLYQIFWEKRTIENTAFDGVSKAWTGVRTAWEYFAVRHGLQEKPTELTYNGKMTFPGMLYKLSQGIGYLSGLPLPGAMRDGIAVWNNSVALIFPRMKVKTYDAGAAKEIQYAFQDGWLTDEEAVRYLVETGEVKNREEAEKTVYRWSLDGAGVYDAVKAAALKDDSKAYEKAIQELESNSYDREGAESAVRTAVKAGYLSEDGKQTVSKQEAIRLLQSYGGMSADAAAEKVQKWTCQVVTGIAYDDIDEAFMSGDITASRARQLLSTYGGVSESDATERVNWWAFRKDNPDYEDISEGAVAKYTAYAQPAGISATQYYSYWKATKDMSADKDENGKSVSGSKKEKVMAFIDSMPISSKQKDALYYANGWSESGLKDAPWHAAD